MSAFWETFQPCIYGNSYIDESVCAAELQAAASVLNWRALFLKRPVNISQPPALQGAVGTSSIPAADLLFHYAAVVM